MRLKKIYVLGALCTSLASFQAIAQDNQRSIQNVESIVIGKPATKQTVAKPAITQPETQVVAKPEVQVVSPKPKVVKEVITPSTSTQTIHVVDARDNLEYDVIVETNDVIKERLEGLENIMPMPYNESVQKYIDYFLYKRPSFTREMLEKKERYFPVFDKYLVKHNIPNEMKYLALLESGLNPKAKSHASAVGMWQFMTPTGREMGLTINDFMDERMDVEKSTDASFRYLTQLYKRFDDWQLALAAYNSGPGRISRAIRRSGHTDYWSLHNFIPSDTRAYVPQWQALNYLMNYAAEHGIFPDYNKVLYPHQVETLLVNGYLNLETFAKLNNFSLEKLQDMNPHLTKNEIPAYAKNIELNFPSEHYAYFEGRRASILDSSSRLPAARIYNDVASNDGPYHIEYVTSKKYHTVRSGDHLSKIADNYGVSIADLKRWNNLRSSKILRGQKLAVHVKQSKKIYHNENSDEEETVVASNTPSKTTKEAPAASAQRTNVKVASNRSSEVNVIEDLKPNNEGAKNVTKTIKKYHKVRKGEALGTIAERLDVGQSELKKWNNIRNANDIKYGQSLVYYQTVTEKVYTSNTQKRSSIVHVVEKGDTLWNIAAKYPDVSIDEIKRLNNLSSNTVKVGQKLKLKS
ncbi:membrane-bound lytic murein transglycosylase D [Spirosomataceae bacterium TFI 002]|nr:membrane-bound lytic murein transglycosylase D [Spirosomataceae bacterium TFI 002]